MSLLQQILDGSLVSRQRLLQARHFYAPRPHEATPEQAFARWTERVAVQSELGGARELAGLSDEELGALEQAFARSPLRPRNDRTRHGFRVAAALAVLGALGLAMHALAAAAGDGGIRTLQVLSLGCILGAVCAAVVGAYAGFGTLHLDIAHGTLGLYVGRLDEQHPWLYDAASAARHPAADEYRRKVLRERGALRGADVVIMREIVRAQEAIERTEWPSTLAEHVQRDEPAADAAATEPRLVHSRGTKPHPIAAAIAASAGRS